MPASALEQELAAAFDLAELRRLLAGLGVTPETVIPPSATVDAAALEIVAWARRHNRLCDLADAAAGERPQNTVIQAVARLMPAVAEGGRRVGTPPENERRSSVTDPGGYGSNGVREALGRYGAQIDALRDDVSEVREAVAAVPTMRQEIADVRRSQRTQFWVQLGLWTSTLAGIAATAYALARHVWGG